jgi:hypothetical protein
MKYLLKDESADSMIIFVIANSVDNFLGNDKENSKGEYITNYTLE